MSEDKSDEQLNEMFDTLENGHLSLHATYLGQLCIAWSLLETGLNIFLISMMHPSPLKTSVTILNNLNLRDKIATAVPLAFQKQISKEWYSEVSTLLNEINNNLRPRRNRMIHDTWIGDGDTVYRVQNHAKVVKAQSHTLQMSFESIEQIKVSDICILVIEIFAAYGKLNELTFQHPDAKLIDRASPKTDA